MKRLLPLTLLSTTIALADVPLTCDSLTDEQMDVLDMAYTVGLYTDYQLSITAIVAHESFIGSEVVPIRPEDGLGSYGVSQVLLTTAAWIEGLPQNRDMLLSKLAPKLINNPPYATELGLKYLQIIDPYGPNKTKSQWHDVWNLYNGNSKTYSRNIAEWVTYINDCEFYKYWDL